MRRVLVAMRLNDLAQRGSIKEAVRPFWLQICSVQMVSYDGAARRALGAAHVGLCRRFP